MRERIDSSGFVWLTTLSAAEAAEWFEGASRAAVEAKLELLAGAGEVWRDAEGRYRRVERVA